MQKKLNKQEIYLMARVLKAFEDMGASMIDLDAEKNKFENNPNLIYDWANTLKFQQVKKAVR